MSEEFPHPQKEVLKVLKGKISEPVETLSKKPGQEDKIVSPRLVKEGSGMVGLKNLEDNKEWSGILNHVLRTARLSSFLAGLLKEKGVDVDQKMVLNTVLVSHSGRRQWDESRWYPDAVENMESKKTKTDTEISIELLEKAGVSPTIIENIKTHDAKYSLEKIQENWVAKIALYADFRTSQNVMSLDERFDDLEKRAVPDGRITKEELDELRKFYKKTEEEIFSIIKNKKPEEITDIYPRAPLWENYIRRLYIQDAEENIFEKYSALKSNLEKAKTDEEAMRAQTEINASFPENTWWGKYVKELYEKQKGEVYKPTRKDMKTGIERAIENFED